MMNNLKYTLYFIELTSCIVTLLFHLVVSIVKCQEIIEQYDISGLIIYVLCWAFIIIIAYIGLMRITGGLLGHDFED